MKKIIPLIFSVLYVLTSNAQAVGGWGTCEFATVATMNAFDPSTNAYDCKKVFVQATNEHYYWNGTIWVLVQDTNTDDQNASEVPFTPVGTIVATDVQAAIAEIEPDIYGSIDVHSDVDVTTTTPSNGDILAWDGSNFVPSATDNGYTVFNIFAEESADLNLTGQTEWAFGNGDNTPSGHGIVIPVDCELFAMSLDHESSPASNTTVRIIKNTDASLSTYQVTNSGVEQNYITFGTPLSFTAGDLANFTTISATQGGNSARVSAWFRIRSTPASTSLVNDMLDVSAGSIASGDILYFNGSSFVPLTLEAGNIPYDNSISSLTATDVQAAIDELASGSSSDNIYNTDGTLDANREVTQGNFDIEFNSTGTGNFYVSDNGTVVFAVEDDNVGIGIAAPLNPLHIFETTGTPASATNGTIFLEKGDSGGSQSIVFESNVNAGNDYAYIEYSDDGSGNGSTTENSLLVIGTENDAAGIYQDDIAIMPSGYLGVGTTSPDAFFDVDGGQVRFSNYGIGTYDDASPARILGVDANGDIIEVDPSTLGGGSSSGAFGTIYITNEVENTLTEDVPEKAEGTTELVDANDVDMPANNRLRYTGSSTQTFFVSCNISVRVDENDRQIYFSIRKNGVDIPSIVSAKHNRNTNSTSELNSTTITGTVELSTNDYIELWVENVENGADVTVHFMNLSMIAVGGGGGGGGGSGDNIYTANGNLGADRTVNMNGNDLTFDGTSDMIITEDGEVGIGILTPGAQLEVTHNRNQSFTGSEPDDGVNTFLSSIAAINTNSTTWSRALTSLTPNIADGSVSGLITFGQGDATRQSGHMYFVDTGADGDEYIGFAMRNGSSDILNITGAGNVGIGTTSPNALLDVAGGNVRFSDYGNGTITGTLTRILGVDVDGDIIEVDPSSLGGGGGGSNIYTSNGTLSGNRTVTMNGNDLTFDSGSGSNFTIDGFTGSAESNPIFQIDRNGGRELKFFHEDDDNNGYWNIGTNDGIALEVDNTAGNGIYLEYTGNIGIGTSTPDRKLDVQGGQVRFSNYGPGTYEDTTAVYLLGVEDDGDLIEMNTAKNSRIFYPPAIAIVADAIDTDLTLDLHQTYLDLFQGGSASFVKSTSAPGAIPTYAQDELYYYILEYDTSVFANVEIDDNGLMEYDVIAPASDNCSFINIAFVIKEP